MKRSVEEKRYRRHLQQATRHGAWCALCQGTALGGVGLEWLDCPRHPERGRVFFTPLFMMR